MNILEIKATRASLNIQTESIINDDVVEKICARFIDGEEIKNKIIFEEKNQKEFYRNTCRILLIVDEGIEKRSISCFIRNNRIFIYGISLRLESEEKISIYSFEIPEEVDKEKIKIRYISNTFEIVLDYKKEFYRKKIHLIED